MSNTLSTIEKNVILSSQLFFIVTINIGSNNQIFNLLLDTGSYITWVSKKGSTDKYTTKNHYDPSTSTTSYYTKEPFVQTFNTGDSKGYLYTDNVTFIDNINFNFKFGVADNTNLYINGADGILGLSHYYENEDLSFIHMLKKNQIISSTVFSLKYQEDILVGMTGKLIIGKHNDFLSKDTVSCPLINFDGISNKYWGCEITALGIKNKDYHLKSNIIFDTTSNVIILPEDYYKELRQYTGCSIFFNYDHSFGFSCKHKERFDFRIKINGYIFVLSQDIAFYKYENDDDGYTLEYRSKIIFHEDTCIMGIPFFIAFHTLFDKENEKLHFYPEHNNYIIKDEENKEDDKNGLFSFSVIIIISICITVILVVIVCLYIKRKKRKEEDKTINIF